MARIGRMTKEDNERINSDIINLMGKGASVDIIAKTVDLQPDTVRKRITKIRKEWSEQGLTGAETKDELIARANNIALLASAGYSRVKEKSANGEAAFLKLQLEVIDRIAKLAGVYAPEKTEITGKNGGPIQLEAVDHPVDKMDSAELARRMRNWAEALEEESNGQQSIPTVVEGTSENI